MINLIITEKEEDLLWTFFAGFSSGSNVSKKKLQKATRNDPETRRFPTPGVDCDPSIYKQ